jgi:hypothetical protein
VVVGRQDVVAACATRSPCPPGKLEHTFNPRRPHLLRHAARLNDETRVLPTARLTQPELPRQPTWLLRAGAFWARVSFFVRRSARLCSQRFVVSCRVCLVHTTPIRAAKAAVRKGACRTRARVDQPRRLRPVLHRCVPPTPRAARGVVVDGGEAWVARMRVSSLCGGGAADAPALCAFRRCHRHRGHCWLGEAVRSDVGVPVLCVDSPAWGIAPPAAVSSKDGRTAVHYGMASCRSI